MSACFAILESTIAYMISESPLSLDEDQINQLHAAMVGAFNAVLFFLSQCQVQAQDEVIWVRYPLSIVSTAVAGNLFRPSARWYFPEQLGGRSGKRKHQNVCVYITILLLQSRQIIETAGAACHEEVCQCPARWMSSTTK